MFEWEYGYQPVDLWCGLQATSIKWSQCVWQCSTLLWTCSKQFWKTSKFIWVAPKRSHQTCSGLWAPTRAHSQVRTGANFYGPFQRLPAFKLKQELWGENNHELNSCLQISYRNSCLNYLNWISCLLSIFSARLWKKSTFSVQLKPYQPWIGWSDTRNIRGSDGWRLEVFEPTTSFGGPTYSNFPDAYHGAGIWIPTFAPCSWPSFVGKYFMPYMEHMGYNYQFPNKSSHLSWRFFRSSLRGQPWILFFFSAKTNTEWTNTAIEFEMVVI